LDLGFSGDDWISETGAKVVKVCDLKYAKQKIKKVRWVLAVPQNSDIKSVKDLQGKTVSTEAVGLARNYLKKKGVKAKVEFSWGATEVKPPRFVDAIIDVTETGASLKANNLKILDTVLESSTKLIANKKVWRDKWKKEKIKNLALLLLGVIKGEEEVSLTMHVSGKKIKKVLKVLPDLKLPTVRKIVGQDWYSVAFDCKKDDIRQVIPKLKRMGCQGIIEFSATKIIR